MPITKVGEDCYMCEHENVFPRRPAKYYTGDEWRWQLTSSTVVQKTISVIEPAVGKSKKSGRRVPFGFGIRDNTESDPLLWEGDGA